MPVISLTSFSGVAPRVPPYALAPNMAQVALNCEPAGGSIRPMPDTITIQAGLTNTTDASTLYKFGGSFGRDDLYWFHWAGKQVDVVKGAIAGDTTERTFFVKDGIAYKTDASLALTGGSGDFPWRANLLGVPYPVGAPDTLVTDIGDPDYITSRIYIYTFVTSWGEESSPSQASLATDVALGQVVTVSGLTSAPAGDYDITAIRLYRTVGADTGTYNFVVEIPIGSTSYVDTKTDEFLGEPCPSLNWSPVPALDGMFSMANGMVIGFKGNEIIPCEAYRPFAAPDGYRLATDYKIVGGASFGTAAVLCTEGVPYLLQGNEPSSLSLSRIELPQSCLSKRSIASAMGGVIYASPDGLIYVSPGSAPIVLTEGMFGPVEWGALSPNTMHGYALEDRYVGFYDTGSVQGGFIFNLRTKAFSFLDFYATAGHTDLIQDALYLKIAGDLVKFEAGVQEYAYTWRSKKYRMPKPINFSFGQVLATAYPVTMKLYVDTVLQHTEAVASNSPFRLPAGFLGSDFEIELSGAKEIVAAHLATSMQELKEIVS